MEDLPYMPGTKAWKQKWQEAMKNREEAIEVNCFGTKQYKIRHGLVVELFNEKLGIWQEYPGVEHNEICPVCGRVMLVRAIKGTTYLACCSKECYKKYLEWRKAKKNK